MITAIVISSGFHMPFFINESLQLDVHNEQETDVSYRFIQIFCVYLLQTYKN